MIHEDERRTLEDWPEAKIITAKTECVLGNHYHKVKTEKFILVSGGAEITRDGWTVPMIHGVIHDVNPGVKHSFSLSAGSVLIGLCSHPYDPSDDYR